MVTIKKTLLLVLFPALACAQCTVTAPNVNLLSANGLAGVWTLAGTCSQADVNTRTFIEATIFEPAKNKIFAYSPLLITNGTKVLAKPVVPKISNQAVIVYHFGSDANTITLQDHTNGATLTAAKCVNGLHGGTVFGQFAYCNAQAFFAAASVGLKKGNQIPPLGKALDGTLCPTSRSFAIVDQDQSDNVVTKYLQIGNNTVQDTAANRKMFKNSAVVINPSDEVLLSEFVEPAIGCKPFTIPALDDLGTTRSTLAGNELLALFKQPSPIALVPLTDPMTLDGVTPSLTKTNLYRIGAGQPAAATPNDANGTTYCVNLGNIAPPTILRQGRFTSKFKSLVPAVGDTLFTFLGARFQGAWGILNCTGLTGMKSPIVANLNGKGVAVSLTFTINGKTIGPTKNGIPGHHRRHHHHHHRRHRHHHHHHHHHRQNDS